LKSNIVTSFLWDFFGKIGTQIISFGLGIFLARLLSPKEYGLIGLSMVFITLTGVFSNLGLGSALIQRENPTQDHYSSTFFLNIFAGFIIFVLFLFGAPFIAIFFKEPQIEPIIQVLSIGILITSFGIVQNVQFTKNMLFKKLTTIRIITMIISGIIGLILAIIGYGVWSLVVQTLISNFLNTFLLWYFSKWRPIMVFKWKALKELWNYGFKMFLSGLIDTIFSQISSIVIAKFFSAKELGLFSRANSLNRFVIKYSSESVGAVTFPAMSQKQGNIEEVIKLGKKTEILVAFISFGLLGLLYVSSESLILFLLGKKWIEAIWYYKILCFSGFAYPISAATLSILKATGNSGKFLKVEILKKIILILGMGVGFYFGIKGYLISLVFTGAIGVLLNMYFVSLAVPFSVYKQLKGIYIYLIISVFVAFIVSYIPLFTTFAFLNLIQQILIYCSLYFIFNSILKTEGIQSVKLLINKIFSKKT
jgi:teichuronic acid exporter